MVEGSIGERVGRVGAFALATIVFLIAAPVAYRAVAVLIQAVEPFARNEFGQMTVGDIELIVISSIVGLILAGKAAFWVHGRLRSRLYAAAICDLRGQGMRQGRMT